MQQNIEKIFPSDIKMDTVTFLNNKKACGQLYSILLEHSYPVTDEEGKIQTYCAKDSLNFTQLADKKHFNCTPRTITNRIKKLEQFGYITFVYDYKNKIKGYYIVRPNPPYKKIKLSTIKYLNSIFKLPLIKVYIYLGVRYEWAKKEFNRPYNFTKKEIIDHCGITDQHREEYHLVDMILFTLNKIELIKTRYITIQSTNQSNLALEKIEIFDWTDKINIDPAPYTFKESDMLKEKNKNTTQICITEPTIDESEIDLTQLAQYGITSEEDLQQLLHPPVKEVNFTI